MELDAHPDKRKWMARAATLRRGRNKGEFNRELNPEYRQMVTEASEQIASAKG